MWALEYRRSFRESGLMTPPIHSFPGLRFSKWLVAVYIPQHSSRIQQQRAKRTCSVPGCDNPSRGRGFCGKHYARWKTTGSTDDPPGRQRTYFKRGAKHPKTKLNEQQVLKIVADPRSYSQIAR